MLSTNSKEWQVKNCFQNFVNIVFEAQFNFLCYMEKSFPLHEIFKFLYFKPSNQLWKQWHHDDYFSTQGRVHFWMYLSIHKLFGYKSWSTILRNYFAKFGGLCTNPGPFWFTSVPQLTKKLSLMSFFFILLKSLNIMH